MSADRNASRTLLALSALRCPSLCRLSLSLSLPVVGLPALYGTTGGAGKACARSDFSPLLRFRRRTLRRADSMHRLLSP